MELPQPYKDMIYSNSRRERIAIMAALEYLPDEMLEKWKDRLGIFTMDGRHGIRIGESLRKKEMIFLSEKIWPPENASETEVPFRFFVFVVLHEIAHVELEHDSQDKNKEEREADEQAMEWFNAHLDKVNLSKDKPIPFMTRKEISTNKDFIEDRDWTYNSRIGDISGFFCLKLFSGEISSVFTLAEKDNVSAEVMLKSLLRDSLNQKL